LGERFDAFSAEIDLLDSVAIFAFKVSDHVFDAGTCCLRKLRFVAQRRFGCEAFMRSEPRRLSSMVVSDGIAEDAVKPSDSAFIL
jgi:hypothetical protein